MRKKLFAVIMSAMMMITFMPTMAFAAITWNADSVVSWNDYVKATVKYVASGDATNTYTDDVDVVRTVLENGNFDGKVNMAVKGITGTGFTKSIYDLDFAKVSEINNVSVGNGKIDYETAQSMFGPDLDQTVNVTELKFSVPTYVKNYNTDWTSGSPAGTGWVQGDQTKELTSVPNMSFKVAAPAFNSDDMYTKDQPFELALIPTFTASADGTFVGMVPAVKLTIVKTKATVDTATYKYADKFNGFYDGAEHTFEQAAMTGITSTYELYNTKTGKYEAVDAVKVKDVGTYNIKATAKDANGKTKTYYITKEVEESCGVQFGFKKDYFKVSGKFDPLKYLKVEYVQITTPTATAEAIKSAKKAVKADQKEIVEYISALCKLDVDEDSVATIKENTDLTPAEVKAIEDKFEVLIKNYNENFNPGIVEADVKVIDDITFTKAPLTKTYKAKKGKLPKNKTFYVKAKVASGADLVYKVKNGAGKIVINRDTGKVTVKKGIKKGTYKVKVLAISLSSFGDGEYEISDSYTLKVKIK